MKPVKDIKKQYLCYTCGKEMRYAGMTEGMFVYSCEHCQEEIFTVTQYPRPINENQSSSSMK